MFVVTKPFQIEVLANKVREVVEQH